MFILRQVPGPESVGKDFYGKITYFSPVCLTVLSVTMLFHYVLTVKHHCIIVLKCLFLPLLWLKTAAFDYSSVLSHSDGGSFLLFLLDNAFEGFSTANDELNSILKNYLYFVFFIISSPPVFQQVPPAM